MSTGAFIRNRIARGARRSRRKPGEMTKVEAKYASYLESLKYRGEIIDYRYEPVNLRLADKTYYRPDFLVINKDLELEYHEAKGSKKITSATGDSQKTFWSEPDAKARIKIAAEAFPWFRFLIVWEAGPGVWGREEM